LGGAGFDFYVLNASRHRISLRIDALVSIDAAISAQRLSASDIATPAPELAQAENEACSTPLGIGYRYAQGGNAGGGCCRVLNASRHRISLRSKAEMLEVVVVACSTPLGIGYRYATADSPQGLPHRLCSTPLGIGYRYAPPIPPGLFGDGLCSTPLGIGYRYA